MPTNTKNLIRLPHTGMRVPDRSLAVARIQQLNTARGTAYTALLTRHGRHVGTIENNGCGGPTVFEAKDGRRSEFGERALEQYAQQCQADDGTPVTAEVLMENLLTEHQLTEEVTYAAVTKKMTLRRWAHQTSSGDLPAGTPWIDRYGVMSHIPGDADARRILAGHLMDGQYAPSRHGWWQGWLDGSWQDMTERPEGVPTDLYH